MKATSDSPHLDARLANAAINDIFNRFPDYLQQARVDITSVNVRFRHQKLPAGNFIRSADATATIKLQLSSYVNTNTLNQI